MSGPRPAMTNIGRISCVGVAERIAVFLRNSEPSASFADTRRQWLSSRSHDRQCRTFFLLAGASFNTLVASSPFLFHPRITWGHGCSYKRQGKALHFSFSVLPRPALVASPPYSSLVPLLSVCGCLSEVDDIQLGSERSDFIQLSSLFLT